MSAMGMAANSGCADSFQPRHLTDRPWAKRVRCVPNELVRYALFSIGTTTARQQYQCQELARIDEGLYPLRLTFTGIELRQDDLDVYLALLHVARDRSIDRPVSVKRSDLLKILEWGSNSFYYKRLLECMRRLKSATLEGVISRKYKEAGEMRVRCTRFSFSLLDRWKHMGDNGKVSRTWEYQLPVELIDFFAGHGFTRIDWEARKALGNSHIAKWLQIYFASHKKDNRYAISVARLQSLCGSKDNSLPAFRQSVDKALKLLASHGVIQAKIDPESDRILVFDDQEEF